MKKTLFQIWFLILASSVFAQNTTTLHLNPPDTDRGLPVMKALTLRASASDWDSTQLDLQDLSDLLWAANGINRPESGKRTAPSALNAQDIDIYVCMKSGVYLYDAKKNLLELVVLLELHLEVYTIALLQFERHQTYRQLHSQK